MQINTQYNNFMDPESRLKQASGEFAAIFFQMMLKSMRESIDKSDLMDGGHAEEIYRGMLDEKYAEQMGKSSELARMIERQLQPLVKPKDPTNLVASGHDAYRKALLSTVDK